MPSSTRSNKETQLLFSSDPASLERSSAKEYVPHRSTTTLVRRSIFVSHRRSRHQSHRPTLAHHHRPKTLFFRRPTSSIRPRSILQSEHRSILNRETWLRPWYLYGREGRPAWPGRLSAKCSRSEDRCSCGWNPWVWYWCYMHYSTCRWGCSTQNVGWLQPSRSVLHQGISHSSSNYSGGGISSWSRNTTDSWNIRPTMGYLTSSIWTISRGSRI